jgi:hypothetical protein
MRVAAVKPDDIAVVDGDEFVLLELAQAPAGRFLWKNRK